ncbi:MAG: nitroreductase family protein [Proteobacteria bacterium]|nr:nitroreductase family protein [Pseudomonadota bacterium]
MDTNATDLLLTTTRAVRRRLDLERPVPRELIEECLRIAIQAPTGGNSQGWRWVVVTDADVRLKLAELYRSQAGILEQMRKRAKDNGDQATERVYQSAIDFAEVLHKVPVLLIPCIQGRVNNASNPEVAGLYGSIIPAAWSFMLAARSRGLGTVWTSIHLAKEKEAAELLGIPDDFIQVALIPVAYTKGIDFKPAKRTPVEEVTYWDHWGDN